jgi:hypothetical protein
MVAGAKINHDVEESSRKRQLARISLDQPRLRISLAQSRRRLREQASVHVQAHEKRRPAQLRNNGQRHSGSATDLEISTLCRKAQKTHH